MAEFVVFQRGGAIPSGQILITGMIAQADSAEAAVQGVAETGMLGTATLEAHPMSDPNAFAVEVSATITPTDPPDPLTTPGA
jgi:hypothetical protein